MAKKKKKPVGNGGDKASKQSKRQLSASGSDSDWVCAHCRRHKWNLFSENNLCVFAFRIDIECAREKERFKQSRSEEETNEKGDSLFMSTHCEKYMKNVLILLSADVEEFLRIRR